MADVGNDEGASETDEELRQKAKRQRTGKGKAQPAIDPTAKVCLISVRCDRILIMNVQLSDNHLDSDQEEQDAAISVRPTDV